MIRGIWNRVFARLLGYCSIYRYGKPINVETPSVNQEIVDAIAFARIGDTESIEGWLQAGGNPNKHDPAGWTPLLWAAVRAHAETVTCLLDKGANIALAHGQSGALPIHMAGHSGDIRTTRLLLERRPEHIDAVWDLNGHTVLLQAVFYGHLELARFLVEQGANTSITTARGLGAIEFAKQFQNQKMMDVIHPYDSPAEAKAAYYQSYLRRIAPLVPDDQKEQQALADHLVAVIEASIRDVEKDPNTVKTTLDAVKDIIEVRGADPNRLGGSLQQPPLIVVVTGNNGLPPNPNIACLRNELASYLLEKGADPTLHEKHPMGAQTIIRAAVFNHLEILKMCASYLTARQLADAINEIPIVNGLTALHDTVLRATMAAPDHFEGYLNQARWFMQHGGRSDLEDFAGVTQRNIAERVENNEVRKRLLKVLDKVEE